MRQLAAAKPSQLATECGSLLPPGQASLLASAGLPLVHWRLMGSGGHRRAATMRLLSRSQLAITNLPPSNNSAEPTAATTGPPCAAYAPGPLDDADVASGMIIGVALVSVEKPSDGTHIDSIPNIFMRQWDKAGIRPTSLRISPITAYSMLECAADAPQHAAASSRPPPGHRPPHQGFAVLSCRAKEPPHSCGGSGRAAHE
ncbi:MAG: hypothetical protein DVB26_04745 [Verrucomicrobia bacterium]|nr:MAG: hypothetical protein DVB26_04745 [Verrucomicrobiota bacterium]